MAMPAENEPVLQTSAKASTALSPGSVIDDRYKIESYLGKGGMSVVYKAQHLQLNRPVAFKVLQDQRLGDAKAIERFRREAQAIAQIKHPNIVEIYGFGIVDEKPYMAMEFIDGFNFAQLLQDRPQGRFSIEEARPYFEQICDAVAAAHSKGVLHRDLKPGNVVLNDGTIKLIDFGIAKLIGDSSAQIQALTQTGTILGSVAYMSPESLTGGVCDERSDIYSLGCLMYEILTGHPPFSGESPFVVIAKHVDAHPSVPPELHNSFGQVILQTLEKNPANRPQTVQELKRKLIDPPPVRQKQYMVPAICFGLFILIAISCGGIARWRSYQSKSNDVQTSPPYSQQLSLVVQMDQADKDWQELVDPDTKSVRRKELAAKLIAEIKPLLNRNIWTSRPVQLRTLQRAISDAYCESGQYAEALPYRQILAEHARWTGDPSFIVESANNVSVALLFIGRAEDAVAALKAAESPLNRLENQAIGTRLAEVKKFRSILKYLIGVAYIDHLSKPAEALPYFEACLKFPQTKEVKRDQIASYILKCKASTKNR
jgi:serine/threonine protein kinase